MIKNTVLMNEIMSEVRPTVSEILRLELQSQIQLIDQELLTHISHIMSSTGSDFSSEKVLRRSIERITLENKASFSRLWDAARDKVLKKPSVIRRRKH